MNPETQNPNPSTQATPSFDFDKLTQALRDANAAAMQASKEYLEANPVEDGSCNLDSLVLRVPKGTRRKRIESCAQSAGITVTHTNWFGAGYFLNFDVLGQAMAREKGLAAARGVVESAGFRTSYYAQMD